MGDMIRIPIAKGGKGAIFEIDTDDLNEAFESNGNLMMLLVTEGLKVVLNSRMSKLAAPSKLEGKAAEDNKAAALTKAAENYSDFKSGKLSKKTSAAKAEGVDRAVMTEALRLAKAVVKNEIRKAGQKPSLVAAKEITEYAKQFVEADPSYIEQAKDNIAALKAKADAAVVETPLNIKLDPKLVKKAEEAKAARKEQLSAKQAGTVAKRGGAKVPPRRPEAAVH